MTDPPHEARALAGNGADAVPELFPGPLAASLAGEALKQGLWALDAIAIREFGLGRHRAVDDTPAGGGAGMVLRADVLGAAIDAPAPATRKRRASTCRRAASLSPRPWCASSRPAPACCCWPAASRASTSASSRPARLREVSIGDYVLSGGELAAMVLIDAVVRLLPGVVGQAASLAEESFEAGLLEYPHYTRPREWEGRPIPDVLLSGDHKRIAEWRRAQAERLTAERRPDLARTRRGKRDE